ncbi:MAG: alpha/beta hydrolase, partial [Phenylobacterium sp.]
DCVKRMADANPRLSPQQARHLTIYGALQNEDGSWSWKFDSLARGGATLTGLVTEEQRELWREIDAPVLLVRGTESWAPDPSLDGSLALFRNARLANFEGAGHWVHHDRLDAYMAEVEAFLAE